MSKELATKQQSVLNKYTKRASETFKLKTYIGQIKFVSNQYLATTELNCRHWTVFKKTESAVFHKHSMQLFQIVDLLRELV